jgi:hypothetical protein
MRIQEAQKHTDPEHCKKDSKVLNQTQYKKIRKLSNSAAAILSWRRTKCGIT